MLGFIVSSVSIAIRAKLSWRLEEGDLLQLGSSIPGMGRHAYMQFPQELQ
jgi:hypothetical protein